MLKIGLTGGIGSGKSTAIRAFQALGAEIVDADNIARNVLAPNSDALMKVVAMFGSAILLDNNELDRNKLKALIFAPNKQGEAALAQLEAITHPIIRAEITRQMDELISASRFPYLIVDIPLLIEKNYQSLFDRVVVVDCSVEQQVARVKNRDTIEVAIIEKIIDQQASRIERLEVATDVIDNSSSKTELCRQVEALHKHFVHLSLR